MTYSHHRALDGMRARGPIVLKVRHLIQPRPALIPQAACPVGSGSSVHR